ncbi:putative reverse transcriptase domain-containing protein [Tanacetum coccineum]
MSVKYPNYVNLTSSSEEQPNERTPSPPPRKKSLSPPQAPSKSISRKSTHYTSLSSPSKSLTPTHVAPPPILRFVIPIKLEPQELPPPQISPNDPYAQTMDNWPPGPSNSSPPLRVSRPPPGFSPVLEDEDEDPKEEEFEEEKEDPQEEEDDMEVDIEEDENEPQLTYPYEETDSLNPPPPASEFEPDNGIEVENLIEHEDKTVPVSVYERPVWSRDGVCSGSSRKSEAKDKFYGKLILDLGNEVRSSVDQGTAAMERLVEKLGNVKEKTECKKLKKELEEAKLSNTFLRMHNERVERDLYWTRVRAHEFYQEMIRKGFVFEERPNEAIDVPIKDVKSSSLKEIMPPKSAPMTQAAMRRMIKESVDAAIAVERERQAKVRNDASGSGPVRGQNTAPTVRECTFAGFIKCNPTVFRGIEGAIELHRWFEKTESVFGISECAEGKKARFAAATLEGPALTWWNSKVATLGLENNLKVKEYDIVAYTQRFNELALMCPRMVEPERVKVDAYIRGLTDNIKGEVTSSKPANLSEANNQKQGNARAMVTAPTDGKLPLCERCFTRHVGPCTIKCHKCGKVGHKSRYCKEKNVATGANAQPIPTCYDCGEQGHTRNRCPKKVKQEEVREVRARAYAIKDAEPKGPNVVTGTFLLNNRYASVLFDSGSDRSFVAEVELADGRVVSTNTVLKGFTVSLVNHIFEIDLMPIELGTFDVIIGMDWLVKHDAVIVCSEKVVRIPYGNKTLIVEGKKVGSRLKIISCIKARKYVEQSCHLFLAHITKKKSKEKRMEDVPIIRDFPEVFPEELPGLPPPRQVEFLIDLVPGAAPVARALYRLPPSEMKELSVQLQELLEKGFIRPSSSTWGAPDEEEHGKHLKIILELLKKERLYAKFLKCDFWLDSVQFLGYVIDRSGVHVDPTKIEAIKSWAAPTTPMEVRQFLGLAGYYQRFIEGFSLISKPLTKLTQKNKKYKWGEEEEEAFQTLK